LETNPAVKSYRSPASVELIAAVDRYRVGVLDYRTQAPPDRDVDRLERLGREVLHAIEATA
jgi:hypothetical protein